MEQNPSTEAKNRSGSEEIPRFFLCKPMVHYRVHNSPPLAPILSQMNPVHNIPSYSLRSILILYFHLRPGFPSGLFPSDFPNKILHPFLISPIRTTSSNNLTILDMITLLKSRMRGTIPPFPNTSSWCGA